MLENDVLIFDIGCNNGHFIDKCLSEYNNPKIIGVEANDKLIPVIKNKFINNSNVIILNYVVSSKNNEEIDFYISNISTISTADPNWMNNSRFSNKHSWNRSIKKQSINLDYLIELYGKPNLIKIDVEGYEFEVLKGLSNRQSEICFEWTEEYYENLNEICFYLQNIGYEDFGFTYEDNHLDRPNNYSTWGNLDLHKDINPNRKEKWGMIWVK